MCDSGRTSGNRNHKSLLSDLCFFCLCLGFLFFFLVRLCQIDHMQKVLRALCLHQILCKLLIHQKDGQATKYLQMHIVFCIWCCDQKDDMHRFSVKCIVFYALWHDHGCQPRCRYCIRLTMWDCNPLSDTCRSFFFSCKNPLQISVRIRDVAAFAHQVYHLSDGIFLACWCPLQLNAFYTKQISHFHV